MNALRFRQLHHLAELLLEHGCEMDYRVIACPREGRVVHAADARRRGAGPVVVYGSGDSYDAAVADLYRGLLAYGRSRAAGAEGPGPAPRWERALAWASLALVALSVLGVLGVLR